MALDNSNLLTVHELSGFGGGGGGREKKNILSAVGLPYAA